LPDEALLQRLEALEARADILNLEGGYARTWDSGDGAGWAELFTEDGAWEALQAGTQAPANLVRGRAELEKFCAQCATFLTGLHFLHMNELHVEGDTAKALVYFNFEGLVRLSGEKEEVLRQLVTGHYHVDYRRTPDGWKIAYRLEQPVAFSSSSYVGGMLQAKL
jgi:ketosteroid isomerase-like protein